MALGSPALSGLRVATCTPRGQGKWLLGSLLRSFFDESKGGAKIVAHWKIEGDGFTEERGWIGVRPVREKMLCVELGVVKKG